jgi:hypothetical protein
MAELTAYEQARAARIAQNRARMAELELDTLAASVAAAAAPAAKPRAPPRGLSAKRRVSSAARGAEPPRRSLRQRGVESDGAQVLSELNGRIVVDGAAAAGGGGAAAAAPPAGPDFAAPELPFISRNAGAASDAAFLRLLRGSSGGGASPGKGRGRGAGGAHSAAAALAALSLAERDVAKVLPTAATHLAFAPRADALVLAAADKHGHVGLFDVDAAARAGLCAADEGDGDGDGDGGGGEPAAAAALVRRGGATVEDAAGDDEDGEAGGYSDVFSFDVHAAYISGLAWAGAGPAAKLFTADYAGALRCLDPARGAFVLSWSDAEREYSAFDIAADGATAYLADKDGGLDVVDLRAGRRAAAGAPLHGRKVNALSLDPGGGPTLLSASTDGAVSLWDSRKLASGGKGAPKPTATAAHRQGCQGGALAPDGSCRAAVTCYDDTVRVYDKALNPISTHNHDNRTGRWVLPFRAGWAPASDGLLVGAMDRAVDVLDAATGVMVGRLRSDAMTAIPARNAAHRELPAVAAGTASGRVHIFR